MKVDMEVIEMVKTLSEFWNEVASICYDSSDYGIIAQVVLSLEPMKSINS